MIICYIYIYIYVYVVIGGSTWRADTTGATRVWNEHRRLTRWLGAVFGREAWIIHSIWVYRVYCSQLFIQGDQVLCSSMNNMYIYIYNILGVFRCT